MDAALILARCLRVLACGRFHDWVTSNVVHSTSSHALDQSIAQGMRWVPRTLYTSVMSSGQSTSVSRTIPGPSTYEQAEGQKELTGPPAKAAATCPRGCEEAGAGPRDAPAVGAGAAAGAATKGPASRSPCPCCHSSPPASTMCRTSTLAAWAGRPAIVLGFPSCEGRRKGTASKAAAARTASGPVAVGTPPVPSSEASMEMCCGLHLGDYIVCTVSHESLLYASREIGG